ncbi:hypothetical protein L596_025314 [Steinernema carpocapsae]|uniref:Uncharacterized protein n=1 Tax=Steinernema carpocapsae TaxID=34508 RepID=A0A4U5M7F5_STECR|nr:hypothetical protein L596_025314 [Steinernema carpocapsae]
MMRCNRMQTFFKEPVIKCIEQASCYGYVTERHPRHPRVQGNRHDLQVRPNVSSDSHGSSAVDGLAFEAFVGQISY